ncbi:MAG: hypothetical protein ACLQAT_00540 [Candidatus Binataceae bacterium]
MNATADKRISRDDAFVKRAFLEELVGVLFGCIALVYVISQLAALV